MKTVCRLKQLVSTCPNIMSRLRSGEVFAMAYTIEENNFRGNSTIQLHIKDIKFAENNAE
jgi:hypothetical protein